MPDPIIPRVISISGSANSVVGDTIRVTAYTGSTARGTTTGVLDSDKRLVVDLANVSDDCAEGDTIVATENGKGLGGSSATLRGGANINITATTVAFPSRSL